jgi:flagellin
MALRVANNINSLVVQKWLGKASTNFNKSLERLSSGYRINRASDDAAGLSISERFRADIASYKVASRNAAEASSLVQMAEGAMNEIGNILIRLKELATQAASGNAGSDLDKLDAEASDLMTEIDRIANSTEYADTKLINGNYGNTATVTAVGINASSVDVSGASAGTWTFSDASGDTLSLGNGTTTQTVTLSGTGAQTVDFNDLGIKFKLDTGYNTDVGLDSETIVVNQGSGGTFQVGAENDSYNKISFNIGDMNTAKLKDGSTLSVDLSTQSGAQSALNDIDTAVSYVAQKRGDLGAIQNRLGYALSNLTSTLENVTSSESVIRDVDMAAEMTQFTKNQILMQSATAMLAQANSAPQLALSLIG